MMKQEEAYDAAVAGGGIAGLTAAVYLQKAGLRVVLCEKENQTGGFVNSFEYEGFTFDAGARSLEPGGVLFPMLRDLGILLPGVKDSLTIGIGHQKITVDSPESLTAYGAMLESLYPQDGPAIQKTMELAWKVIRWQEALEETHAGYFKDRQGTRAQRNPARLGQKILSRIREGRMTQLQVPALKYLTELTGNRSLACILAQHLGSSASAAFALGRTGRSADSWYPYGGTGRLAVALTEEFIRLGGTLKLGFEIQSINLEKDEICGKTGEPLRFSQLVWAANPQRLYRGAEGFHGREWEAAWQARESLVEACPLGDSVLTFFLGVHLPLDYFRDKVTARSLFTPETRGVAGLEGKETMMHAPGEDPKEQEQQVIHALAWTRSFLDRTTYEISIPAFRDAALAPEGETGVIVSTLFDHELVSRLSRLGAYEIWKEDAKEHVIHVLEATLFPGLSEALSFALVSSPLTLAQFSGNPGGTPFGWGVAGEGMPGECRPGRIRDGVNTPAPNVFQAGQWTVTPAGIPECLLTGKLAAEQVLEARRREASGEPETERKAAK